MNTGSLSTAQALDSFHDGKQQLLLNDDDYDPLILYS